MSKSLITIFVISVAFFVIGPVGGTQAGQLDLIIENVAFDEILHYPIITIKNQGDAATNKNYSIDVKYVWLDASGATTTGRTDRGYSRYEGNLLGYPSTGGRGGYHTYYNPNTGLLPGQSAQVGPSLVTGGAGNQTFTYWTWQRWRYELPVYGDAKVLVWVDNKDGQQGIFEESNENNNTKIADLPLADLVIDSADFAYGSNKVVIKNQGNGRAIVPSPDRLKVTRLFLRADGTMIATTTQNLSVDSPIEPGQTVELSGFGFLPYAAKVRVTVDSTAEVLESNENNNDKIINRSQSTLTDFTVEIYGFDRNSGYPIVDVANRGNTFLNEGQSVKVGAVWLREDNSAIGRIAALPFKSSRPGEIGSVQHFDITPDDMSAWAPPEGAVKFWIKIDLNNKFIEWHEDNNEDVLNRVIYPIPELGNCQSQYECWDYCNQWENAEACAAYGTSRRLLTEEEAQALRDMADIDDGPGGCATKESCAEFCEVPANIDACLNYAEQNNWMSADELSKARKVAGVLASGGATPGSCATPGDCKTYCSDNSHAVECVAFGKSAGLLTAEEAAEAEKVAPLIQSGETPGGKTTKEELESYCEPNWGECDIFFEAVGIKKGGDSPAIFKNEAGGPGGCKTKAECDAYCDIHPGECDEAVIEAGGEVKEAMVPCSTNEECKVFCADPANAKVCENVLIEESPEEAEAAKPEVIQEEIEKLRQNILEMPQQSQDCVKQAWGAESFDRVMQGQAPETAVKAETLQSCYAEGVQKAGEEAAKKPEGQEERDAEVQRNSGGNLLQSVINVISQWFER